MCHGALSRGEYVLEVVEDAKLGSYGYSMHARVLDADGVARDVLATYGDADIEGDARLFARQRVVASVSFSEFSEASFSRYASKGALRACEINAGHDCRRHGPYLVCCIGALFRP